MKRLVQYRTESQTKLFLESKYFFYYFLIILLIFYYFLIQIFSLTQSREFHKLHDLQISPKKKNLLSPISQKKKKILSINGLQQIQAFYLKLPRMLAFLGSR